MSASLASLEGSIVREDGRGLRSEATRTNLFSADGVVHAANGVDADAMSVSDSIASPISAALDHHPFDRTASEAKVAFYGGAPERVLRGQRGPLHQTNNAPSTTKVAVYTPVGVSLTQSAVRPFSALGQPTPEETQFQQEHARLVRQLFNSKNRETDMIKQITRLKEALVNSALRLQVAQRVISADNTTIRELRKEASDARREQVASAKREEDALHLIESLRIEISALKRQLRDKTADSGATFSINNAFLAESDAEVTRMLERHGREPLRVSKDGYDDKGAGRSPEGAEKGGSPTKPLMPFQEWKLQHFIWAPDQPAIEHMASAADLAHDLQRKEEEARNALIDEVLANGLPNRRQKKRQELARSIADLMSSSVDKGHASPSSRPRSSGRDKSTRAAKLPGISIRSRAVAPPPDLCETANR